MFPPTEGLAPAESAPAFPAFAVRPPLATARNTYCFSTSLCRQCAGEGAWLASSGMETVSHREPDSKRCLAPAECMQCYVGRRHCVRMGQSRQCRRRQAPLQCRWSAQRSEQGLRCAHLVTRMCLVCSVHASAVTADAVTAAVLQLCSSVRSLLQRCKLPLASKCSAVFIQGSCLSKVLARHTFFWYLKFR